MSVPLFLIPVIVGLAAQFLKAGIHFLRGNRNIRTILMNGGMPSSHAAFVSSLVTAVGFVDGISSTTFTIAVIIAVLIIHDALAIRIHIGRNGKAINALLRFLRKQPHHASLSRIPESIEITGHHPHEVFLGLVFGVAGTLLVLFLVS